MTHGDDAGLMLPPNLAPIQVLLAPLIAYDTKVTFHYHPCFSLLNAPLNYLGA